MTAPRWFRRGRETMRLITDRIPRLMPVTVTRRLIVQAQAARDARLYEVAAALFEEALRFQPNTARFHLQAGHMYKEAQQFAQAEEHYQAARRLRPDDAELALQLGHFYKVSGRSGDAEAAYDKALALRPGWTEATRERHQVQTGTTSLTASAATIIPSLLPRPDATKPAAGGDGLRILRLGGNRARSRGGMLKVLRGVEAVRGFAIYSTPVSEIQLAIDEAVVTTVIPETYPIDGAGGDRRKYVFNIWHDFSGIAPGRHNLAVRVMSGTKQLRAHHEQVVIEPPSALAGPTAFDSVISLRPVPEESLEAQVNALPSMIRSAARTPLPHPIQSILVQRADQLGDLVCSVPALRRLRGLFPAARIVGLMTGANADLARSLGLFDDVVVADYAEDPIERRRVMPADSQIALQTTLAAHDFDLAIDLGEGSDSRALLQLSGARFLYGFKDREFSWLSAGFELNARDPANGLETMAPSRKMLAMIEALGAMDRGDAQAFPVSVMPERLAALGQDPARPYAVLHTGARLAYSRWPGFAELTQLLLTETDLDIVVFVDSEEARSAFPIDPRVRIISGLMPLTDFEALLSASAIFVGNDSGPKHLASLRGARVISLHMARLNWSEWGQEISGSIISRRVPCAGCAISHDQEECGKDFACIRHIRPSEVFDAVRAQLGDI